MIGVEIEFGDDSGVPKAFARGFKALRKALASGDERSGYLAFKLMLAACEGDASEDDADEEDDLEGPLDSAGSRRYGG